METSYVEPFMWLQDGLSALSTVGLCWQPVKLSFARVTTAQAEAHACTCMQVLVHWACTKVSAAADVPDAALRDAITARLAGCPGARYATVAAHAQAIGRKGLAALLLEHETCAAEQVCISLEVERSPESCEKKTARRYCQKQNCGLE